MTTQELVQWGIKRGLIHQNLNVQSPIELTIKRARRAKHAKYMRLWRANKEAANPAN